VASKQIYASHYFQAGLDLLSGVRLGKIRGGVEQGVGEGLRTAKTRTEQ
jgi:hypothetical protein